LKESLLSQPPDSSILGIEVPVIRIPESLHELFCTMSPYTYMHMVGHERVGQQRWVRFTCSQTEAIDPSDEILPTTEQDFMFARQT
jgi:hypothetical protein